MYKLANGNSCIGYRACHSFVDLMLSFSKIVHVIFKVWSHHETRKCSCHVPAMNGYG